MSVYQMTSYSLCSALLLTRAHRLLHYVGNRAPFGMQCKAFVQFHPQRKVQLKKKRLQPKAGLLKTDAAGLLLIVAL